MKMLPRKAKVKMSLGDSDKRKTEKERTRREKPCQGEQVGGKSSGENVETDGSSS